VLAVSFSEESGCPEAGSVEIGTATMRFTLEPAGE